MIWRLIGRAGSSRGPRFGFPMRIRTLLTYRGATSLGMEANYISIYSQRPTHMALDTSLARQRDGQILASGGKGRYDPGLHTVLHLAIDPFLLFGKTGGGPMAEDGLLSWTCAWQEFQLTPTTFGALLVTYGGLPMAASCQQCRSKSSMEYGTSGVPVRDVYCSSGAREAACPLRTWTCKKRRWISCKDVIAQWPRPEKNERKDQSHI